MLTIYPDTLTADSIAPLEAAAMKRPAKHIAKRPANIEWMLDLIATIKEDHEYFKKDYFKPKKLVDETEVV